MVLTIGIKEKDFISTPPSKNNFERKNNKNILP